MQFKYVRLAVEIEGRTDTECDPTEKNSSLIVIDDGSGGDRELQGMICSNPSNGVVILGQSASPGQLMHGK
jgi:hypothetical protein